MSHTEVRAVDHVVFEWDWNRAEYIEVARSVQRSVRNHWFVRVFLASVAGAFALGILTVVYWLAAGDYVQAVQLAPWVAIIAFWLWLLRWWVPRLSARNYEKHHRGARQFFRADNEAVESGTTVSTVRMRWEAFERAVETPEFLLLFYTNNCALFLPKRAVESSDALDRVRGLIHTKMGFRASLS